MKRILIDDMFEVAELMYDVALDSHGRYATFVGLYEDVIELVKNLMTYEEVFIERIDLEPEFLDGYDKEYYVELDSEMGLWVEKAYGFEHEIYMYNETDVLFIADDCNSKILDRIDYNDAYEVGYDIDECDGNCECCSCNQDEQNHDGNHEVITRVATDDNGKLRGFEKSWETHEDGLHYHSTYSYYSNDEDMLKNMLENFSIKY